MVLGVELHIHIDHPNITTENTSLSMPFAGFYGKDYVVADPLSCLHHLDESILSKGEETIILNDLI